MDDDQAALGTIFDVITGAIALGAAWWLGAPSWALWLGVWAALTVISVCAAIRSAARIRGKLAIAIGSDLRQLGEAIKSSTEEIAEKIESAFRVAEEDREARIKEASRPREWWED
jgi:hypothetical protein